MIPKPEDKQWDSFLSSLGKIHPKNLSTKIMMSRIQLLNPTSSSDGRQQAITVAYDFFMKNQGSVADDIQLIFG